MLLLVVPGGGGVNHDDMQEESLNQFTVNPCFFKLLLMLLTYHRDGKFLMYTYRQLQFANCGLDQD